VLKLKQQVSQSQWEKERVVIERVTPTDAADQRPGEVAFGGEVARVEIYEEHDISKKLL